MNGSYSINNYLLCRTGTLLVLLAALTACSGNQPAKVEVQAGKQVAKASSGMHADFLVAMESIKSGKYEDAITLLDKVIAQSPKNPVPYINLALVYIKIEKLTLAEENLKLAIKIDPENPVANNEYAILYRKTGRFAEARQTYENILKKYPNFIMARKNLGILCDLYMNDKECALKQYTIYSGLMPDDGIVKIWIADIQGR